MICIVTNVNSLMENLYNGEKIWIIPSSGMTAWQEEEPACQSCHSVTWKNEAFPNP